MPKQYEAIRDKLEAGGMSAPAAKGHAARIYNSQRGSKPPVTGREPGEQRGGKEAGKSLQDLVKSRQIGKTPR